MLHKILVAVVILAIVLMSLTFGADNNESIELVFLDFRSMPAPLYIWLLGMLSIGMMLGVFFGYFFSRKKIKK